MDWIGILAFAIGMALAFAIGMDWHCHFAFTTGIGISIGIGRISFVADVRVAIVSMVIVVCLLSPCTNAALLLETTDPHFDAFVAFCVLDLKQRKP